MTDYTKQMVKYTKLIAIVYGVIYIVKAVVHEYLYSVYVSLTLSAGVKTAAGMLLALAVWVLFRACFGKPDKVAVYKLLPFAFSPLYFLSLTDSIVCRVLSVCVTDERWQVSAAVFAASAVTAMLVGLCALPSLAKWYAGILKEKGSLVFPLQYGLRRKWWFDLAASISLALLSSAVTLALSFNTHLMNTTWFSALEAVLGMGCAFGLKVLFFRIAFANIDRETRKLFYGHFSGIAGYGAVTNSFISFAYSGIISAGTTLTDVSGGTLQMLAHSFIFLLIAAVISLILLVIGYQYLVRTLKVYEYQM